MTRRERVEQLAAHVLETITVHPVGHYERDEADWEDKSVSTEDFIQRIADAVEQLARQEYAAGLEDAAKLVERQEGLDDQYWLMGAVRYRRLNEVLKYRADEIRQQAEATKVEEGTE